MSAIDRFDAEANNYHEREMVFSHERCGVYHTSLNPLDGSITVSIWRCKDHRNCENCNRVFVQKNKRILEIMLDQQQKAHGEDTELVTRVVDDKEYRSLLRKIGSDNLARFPQDDGSNLVIFPSVFFNEETDYTLDINEIETDTYLQALLTPPSGKRASGAKSARNIEKKESETRKEDEAVLFSTSNNCPTDHNTRAEKVNKQKEISVLLPDLFAAGNREAVEEAARKAIEDTIGLEFYFSGDLVSAERDLQAIINQRISAIRANLWEAGISFFAHYRRVSVNPDLVSW